METHPRDAARRENFSTPPPRKVQCPITDIHTHMTEPATNHELVEAARRYGITRLVAITPLDQGLVLQTRYPGEVVVAARALVGGDGRIQSGRPLEAHTVEMIHRAHLHGVKIIKFWFAPRIRDRLDFLLDSPRLDRAFETLAAYGMGVLVHVSDPNRWFATKYDPARYGTKADQYPMLEARLRRHPTVRFLCAHMGGDPEHLDHLEALLTRYPNLYLDTSATKWMVRELGRQREAARAFITRWAHRICFGTDQVVLKESDPTRYLVRYWVHQLFWETDVECPSPIPDPDSDGLPVLRGLDLPGEVLEQIYWRTAASAFGVEPRVPAAAADRV